MTIAEWSQEVALWREATGFVTTRENMLEKLMLVVSEVAEAAEDVRHARWEHFPEEIADTTIRLLDIAGSLGIDLEAAIEAKMEKNRKRPYRHGTWVSA